MGKIIVTTIFFWFYLYGLLYRSLLTAGRFFTEGLGLSFLDFGCEILRPKV